VLLKAADARYGLIDGFARCLVDDRQSGKVRHTLTDLLAQRIFGLACGYPDANDAERLWGGAASHNGLLCQPRGRSSGLSS
jgi:hypothetical protein